MDAFIEIHHNGAWHRAARLQGFGDDRCRVEYLVGYLFGDQPTPLSLTFPAEHGSDAVLEDGTPDHRVPPFLYDMVPQGRGRRFLVDLLKVRDTGDGFVMPLLFNGAFNPIGCLRIDTAVDFYRQQSLRNPEQGALDGFGISDIEARTEDFLDHMALHAMLAAGTTGVQGVAPKYLLTQDEGGRWRCGEHGGPHVCARVVASPANEPARARRAGRDRRTLDPEVVPRTMHWRDERGSRLADWLQVFDSLDIADDERIELARALAAFAEVVATIPSIAADHGIDAFVLDQCMRSIDNQAEQLTALGLAVGC